MCQAGLSMLQGWEVLAGPRGLCGWWGQHSKVVTITGTGAGLLPWLCSWLGAVAARSNSASQGSCWPALTRPGRGYTGP